MDFIIAAEEGAMSALDKLKLGGSTMLLGIVMVFLVLGILIGLVTLIKVIIAKSTESKAKKSASKAVESTPAPALPVATPVVACNADEEIVAAISAAIAMIYETENVSLGKSVKFRVRSIKEIR